MIESIEVKEASYESSSKNLFGPLNKINLVYGPNGSGKTTISRAASTNSGAPESAVTWRNERPQKVLVYNRDFVANNFRESEKVPGVFTLGEDNVEAAQRIGELSEEIGSRESKIADSKENQEEQKKELEAAKNRLTKKCWKQKNDLQEKLPGSFQRMDGSKKKFLNRCLKKYRNFDGEAPLLEEVQRQWDSIFDDNPVPAPLLPLPESTDLNEIAENALWGTAIVGSSDVELNELVEALGNSVWVRQGLDYMAQADGVCPLCQQSVPEELANELSALFDKQFEAQRRKLSSLQDAYKAKARSLLDSLAKLGEIEPSSLLRVNAKELRLAAKAVRGRIEKNLSLISEKSSQLATKIQLEPVTEDLEVVQDLIKDENQTRRNHNDALNNLDRTKTRLREEAWHLLFDRGIGVACEEHIETVEPIKKALKGLESSIKEHMNQVAKLKLEINELEEKRTSVAPTANWINKMLAAAGFDNFTLAIQDLNKYRIVRAGGDDALETLSEGERSLITFLYFYNLASGSTKTEGTTEKRVLVIDDPVSSLDSHTLFLVSTLVRQLIEKARAAEDKISQVILLTHNIKFHHEVSFGANRKGWDSDLAYWTVRKRGHVSEIEPHNSNPVRSSYEMTWQEALQSASAVQKVTVRNAMRRILETYFGMVGEQTFEDLLPECNPEEMIVVRSLLSWIHAGSHVIDDDLYSTTDPSTVETYREVFRRIFKESGHSAHYDLMVERLQLDASNGEKVSS